MRLVNLYIQPPHPTCPLAGRGYFATCYGEVICLYRQNGKLVKTFTEHTRRIESVELKVTDPVTLQGSMVSGGKDGSIKYWDLKKYVIANFNADFCRLLFCAFKLHSCTTQHQHDNPVFLVIVHLRQEFIGS